MPTTTIEQIELSLVLDGTEYQCQIIDATLTLVGRSAGDTVEVACPDGAVNEPGEHTDGSLTGTVFTDTTATGISWALMQAQQAGATMSYVLTWFADQDNTIAFTYTGDCKVDEFSIDWAKPGYSKHPISLVLVTGTLGRPA